MREPRRFPEKDTMHTMPKNKKELLHCEKLEQLLLQRCPFYRRLAPYPESPVDSGKLKYETDDWNFDFLF